jgi:predicted transcriptional regulator
MNGSKRRNPPEISYDILKAALSSQKKTRLMYQSRLNLKQLNEYLQELTLCELISYHESGRFYVSTEKGRAYVRMFENYRETADLLAEQDKTLARFLTPKAKKPVLVPA